MSDKPAVPANNSMEPLPVYHEDTSSKFLRKTKEAPYVPLGIAGTIGACVYGAYRYKYRGKMSTSVYLMQLRVTAQSIVVGAMTIGVAISLTRTLWKKYNKSDS